MSPFRARPEIAGDFDMVAASHWLAAQTGMAMLERGGNAFDAAVAAVFVLEVVEPHQNGLGGEAPMVLYSAAADAVHVVDGQGPAPALATIEEMERRGLDLVPGVGLVGACVPGAFGALMLVLGRFGTMPLGEVLEPAISYAEKGFPVLPSLSATIAAIEMEMRSDWPTSAAMWLAGGVPAAGARLRNEALAATYRRLVQAGESAGPEREAEIEGARRAYYEGFVAEAVEAFCAEASGPEGLRAGLVRGDDMANWAASLEAPAVAAFRGFEVCKTGPWGQGPVMLQQLLLLDGFDLDSMRPGDPELVHVVTECAKLAFADREAFYGDPRFADVPLGALLSPSYASERRGLVGEEASHQLRPGRPARAQPKLPGRSGVGHAGQRRGTVTDARHSPPPGSTHETRGDTCHLDVADRFGNFVSATPSGGWLQSSPAVEGLGFCLGTRGQMFWLEEDLPSSLAPGKRPRTTLSPGLVLRDGEPYMAFGTPGGDQQDQWPLLAFLNHVVYGLDMQAAIEMPTWHSNHVASSFWPRDAFPNQLVAERRLGEECLAELGRRGHDVVEAGPWTLGRTTSVRRDKAGYLRGAADPRAAQAHAAGR